MSEALLKFTDMSEVLLKVIYAVAIFVCIITINTITRLIFRKLSKRYPRFALFAATARNIIKYGIWILGLFLFLKIVLEIDGSTILTTLGFGSLALTFAAQSIIKDVIMGVFIMIEGQLRIGDEVTIKLLRGTVELIGVRTTRIRDKNGDVHTFNNSEITIITNHSRK